MVLVRWSTSPEMVQLRRQLNDLLNEELKASKPSWKPAVELQNTDDNLIVRVEIPGVEGKNLDIRVTKNGVAIAGERQEQKREQHGTIRTELNYGRFERKIPLPVPIKNNQVRAELIDGILTLTLPKIKPASKRVVKVNLVESTPETSAVLPQQSTPDEEIDPTSEAAVKIPQETAIDDETGDVWAA